MPQGITALIMLIQAVLTMPVLMNLTIIILMIILNLVILIITLALVDLTININNILNSSQKDMYNEYIKQLDKLDFNDGNNYGSSNNN